MNPYADLDPYLTRRAAAEGWTLYTEWAGAPARFFYIGGDGPWDCFQISIDPPASGEVKLWAKSVDTNDDNEFESTWNGAVEDFEGLLTAVVAQVGAWIQRPA